MKRRSLFKAIAAGSLTAASPLACVLARNAMAQNGDRPIRTIFLFHANGCAPDIFFPKAGSSALPAMTKDLQSVYENLVFLDGVGYPGAQGTHEGGCAKCLTGRSSLSDPNPSIDIAMGKEDLANGAVIKGSIQMGVGTKWGRDRNKQISHDGSASFMAECDPRVVYPQVFGLSGEESSGGSTSQKFILDAAAEDLARLEMRLGGIEKERMQLHAQALSDLERAIGQSDGAAMDMLCNGPDISEAPMYDASDTVNQWSETNVLELASELQQQIAITALSCGITKTVAFSYGASTNETVHPTTNLGDHPSSHGNEEVHTRSKIWHMQKVADFINRLKNTPDGSGSLLDNTIIVTVSDLGHGNAHDHYRIPMFLASGVNNNVGLVTGRSLDWRNSPAATKKVLGDRGPGDHPTGTISHTDVLDTIRQVAGYTSFKMPQTEGNIMAAWTGGSEPR